jgi:hypothetical protein
MACIRPGTREALDYYRKEYEQKEEAEGDIEYLTGIPVKPVLQRNYKPRFGLGVVATNKREAQE